MYNKRKIQRVSQHAYCLNVERMFTELTETCLYMFKPIRTYKLEHLQANSVCPRGVNILMDEDIN